MKKLMYRSGLILLIISAGMAAHAQQRAIETSKDNLLGISAGKTATLYSPTHVLIKLHMANQTEIEIGTLAQAHAKAEAARQLGIRLVDEHRQADQKVQAMAKQRQIDLSPANLIELQTAKDKKESMQLQAALTNLSMQQGLSFDKTFRRIVIRVHKKDIAFAEQARDKTDDPALRHLLTELLPGLHQHYAQAKALNHPQQ